MAVARSLLRPPGKKGGEKEEGRTQDCCEYLGTYRVHRTGVLATKNVDETKGFQCLGHSNCAICIPLSHFCSHKISTFSPSYWEANSYYPRGPIMGKGNSPNFKIGWDRWFSVPGPFILDHLHPFKLLLWWTFSNSPTFILGGQFLLPQRANNGKREFTQL